MTLLLGLRERVEQPSLFAEFGPGGRRGPGVHLRRAARDGRREDEQVPGHQSDGAAGALVRGRQPDLRGLRERRLQEHWRGPEDVARGCDEADGPSLVCRSLVALPHERGVPVAGARRVEIWRGARGRAKLRGNRIYGGTRHTGWLPHRCCGWAGLLWSTTTPCASRTPTSSRATTRPSRTSCARRASRSSTRRASRSRSLDCRARYMTRPASGRGAGRRPLARAVVAASWPKIVSFFFA